MSHQLRSELLKLRNYADVALLLLTAAAMSLFGVSVEAMSRDLDTLAAEETQRELFSSGVTIGVLFATLSGLLAVTSELWYGTIRPTLIVEPRRRVVVAAKLAAAALAGSAFAVICVVLTFGAGVAVFAVRDVDVTLTDAHTLLLVAGPIVASMVSAVIGVAVGTLIRNQAGAIVALAAYALLVDAVLIAWSLAFLAAATVRNDRSDV